jgi:hypothetical protein
VRFLQQVGHEHAAEFAAEAADYRQTFLKVIRQASSRAPTWVDQRSRRHPLVPTVLSGEALALQTRHAFYLDGGPLFLVYAGLMKADDPLMRSTLQWFRQGPQRVFYRRDAGCFQVPVLDHEMSSCEPCYSWNAFHAHQHGDRQHFLETMYSLFAGAVSRQTFISCETRGGITGVVFSATLAAWLARLAVIDDQLADDQLHLLRLAPLAWISRQKETAFRKMPTAFGPVSLQFKMSDARTLAIQFSAKFRTPPAKIFLHIPPLGSLRRIIFNGKRLAPSARPIVVEARTN